MKELWLAIVVLGCCTFPLPSAWALSVPAPPPACEIPNPCDESASLTDQQMCAEKAADWIISGSFQKIEGVPTVEPASTLKGTPPLLSYRYGKFYLWKSCWSLTESVGREIRVYGLKDMGVFFSAPFDRPVPGQPPKRPFHQYYCC